MRCIGILSLVVEQVASLPASRTQVVTKVTTALPYPRRRTAGRVTTAATSHAVAEYFQTAAIDWICSLSTTAQYVNPCRRFSSQSSRDNGADSGHMTLASP